MPLSFSSNYFHSEIYSSCSERNSIFPSQYSFRFIWILCCDQPIYWRQRMSGLRCLPRRRTHSPCHRWIYLSSTRLVFDLLPFPFSNSWRCSRLHPTGSDMKKIHHTAHTFSQSHSIVAAQSHQIPPSNSSCSWGPTSCQRSCFTAYGASFFLRSPTSHLDWADHLWRAE